MILIPLKVIRINSIKPPKIDPTNQNKTVFKNKAVAGLERSSFKAKATLSAIIWLLKILPTNRIILGIR